MSNLPAAFYVRLAALAVMCFLVGVVLSVLRPDQALVFVLAMCVGGAIAWYRKGGIAPQAEPVPVRVTGARASRDLR